MNWRARSGAVAGAAAAILTASPPSAQQAFTATDVLGTVFTLYAAVEVCNIALAPEQLAEMKRIGARMQVLSGFPYEAIRPQHRRQAQPSSLRPAPRAFPDRPGRGDERGSERGSAARQAGLRAAGRRRSTRAWTAWQRRNNDDPESAEAAGWASVQDYIELTLDGTLLVLCHYPFRSWNGQSRGSINLHGHSHGLLKPLPKQFDVGVDARDYRPVSSAALLG